MRTLWIALLAGCAIDQADIDTGDPDELPDITGVYTVSPLGEPAGCEGTSVDPSWIEGALTISGPAEALAYTFDAGPSLAGSVDATFTFEGSGTVEIGAEEWVVTFEGLAFLGDSGWNLDGDLSADVLDSTSGATACTLTGLLEAVQDPP